MAAISKRKRAEDVSFVSDDSNPPPFRNRTDDFCPPPSENDNGGEIDFALLEALEKESKPVETLDTRGVKKLVLGLERRLKENLEARMKYMDQPEKFLDSEVELHQELTRMHALAAAPELYPELVRLNSIPSIVGLLSHENTDVAMDVISLLHELTDEDAIGDSVEPATVLVHSLLKNNAVELLAQNITRFDEKDADEATAVYQTLGIIENLAELAPKVTEIVGSKTNLLKWLLTRLKVREFEANKLYCSEVLAILLQDNASNQKRVGEVNGIDLLLQSIALYKSKDAKTGEEEEMVENVFDCLCNSLMVAENKERFVKAEGVELMIIVLKQKRSTYASVLKALDFAFTKCSTSCERFVDVLGLKLIFATFMGKVHIHKKGKRKGEDLQVMDEIEERIISIISSLFAYISSGSRRDRLFSKFVENEYEKIDRLMELFLKYSQKVKVEEKRLKEQQKFNDFELSEDEIYISKLSSGLFTLQLLVLIMAHIYSTGHLGMNSRLDLLLKQQKLSKEYLKSILEEYRDNIGDVDGEEEMERKKKKISKLVSRI